MFANEGEEEVVKIGSIFFVYTTRVFMNAGYYGLLPHGFACGCFFFPGFVVGGA
jgi:hypothetical protein